MNELESFLHTMYGTEEGFVYVPTKHPSEKTFRQKFFSWPSQRSDAIQYIQEKTKTLEVYISPALFKRAKVSYDSFKGTHHVWCEFDGETPSRLGDIPEPSLKIQSSEKGHEHWYWRLSAFESDSRRVAEVSKRLSYSLSADLSGWDATQVLRPPSTRHHASSKIVSVLKHSSTSYPLYSFETLEEAPIQEVPDLQIKDLPDFDTLAFTFKFPYDTFDLIRKPEIPVGSRSSSLTRIAFDSVEMGMSDAEVLSVLYYCDQRWKKFTGRDDQVKRLQGIIAHVRTKKSTQQILANVEVTPYGIMDLINAEPKLDWIVEGILPVAGKGVIYGPPSCGKSTFCIRMSESISLGKDFLIWKVNGKKKVLFISLEMGLVELKDFFKTMSFTEEQILEMNKNFVILPVGHAWPLSLLQNKEKLLQLVDDNEIDVVIFDSLGTLAPGKINSDEDINNLNAFLNRSLCVERNVAYWFVHHPRKPQGQEFREPQDIFDMFGSMYIGTNAQTVLCLWWTGTGKDKTKLKLEFQKSRHTNGKEAIYLTRTQNLNFELRDRETSGKRVVDKSAATLKRGSPPKLSSG